MSETLVSVLQFAFIAIVAIVTVVIAVKQQGQ
jgi:hypothetical protein